MGKASNLCYDMKLMVKRLLITMAAAVLLAVPAMAAPHWLDAKVLEQGHSEWYGAQIRTATVVLLDPENSNPVNRQRKWIIWVNASFRWNKHFANLTPGSWVKAYRSTESDEMVIHYRDAKGRERSEIHEIYIE